MLDAKEQAKGGFGAAAARHREQAEERDAAAARKAADAAPEQTAVPPLDADTTRPAHQ